MNPLPQHTTRSPDFSPGNGTRPTPATDSRATRTVCVPDAQAIADEPAGWTGEARSTLRPGKESPTAQHCRHTTRSPDFSPGNGTRPTPATDSRAEARATRTVCVPDAQAIADEPAGWTGEARSTLRPGKESPTAQHCRHTTRSPDFSPGNGTRPTPATDSRAEARATRTVCVPDAQTIADAPAGWTGEGRSTLRPGMESPTAQHCRHTTPVARTSVRGMARAPHQPRAPGLKPGLLVQCASLMRRPSRMNPQGGPVKRGPPYALAWNRPLRSTAGTPPVARTSVREMARAPHQPGLPVRRGINGSLSEPFTKKPRRGGACLHRHGA